MAATSSPSTAQLCEQFIREARAGNFKPVYFLMGEEAYYIDLLTDALLDAALDPLDRDFNLITLFGLETDAAQIVDVARGYPMGAQRLVVIVKEAQHIKNWEPLEVYLRQPQPSTVLIINYKNGRIDQRIGLAKTLNKMGGLMESAKLRYENQLTGFIASHLRERGIDIEPAATLMLADHIGYDLHRMVTEISKLMVALGDSKKITKDLVAENVGISKEFNTLELRDALATKNVKKVMQIATYFGRNPKANPPQAVLPNLFNFFSELMMAYYSPDKSPNGIASWIGKSPYYVRSTHLPAMNNYSGTKVMQIISAIRRSLQKAQGVGSREISVTDLYKELFFFILHD